MLNTSRQDERSIFPTERHKREPRRIFHPPDILFIRSAVDKHTVLWEVLYFGGLNRPRVSRVYFNFPFIRENERVITSYNGRREPGVFFVRISEEARHARLCMRNSMRFRHILIKLAAEIIRAYFVICLFYVWTSALNRNVCVYSSSKVVQTLSLKSRRYLVVCRFRAHSYRFSSLILFGRCCCNGNKYDILLFGGIVELVLVRTSETFLYPMIRP